jgi:hypothetical protein
VQTICEPQKLNSRPPLAIGTNYHGLDMLY